MDIDRLKSASLDAVRDEFRKYLETQEISRGTKDTAYSDAFYIWRHRGKDCFWDTVTSDDFETKGTEVFREILSERSTGDVPSLVSGYMSNFRRFRDFVLSGEVANSHDEDFEALKDFLLDIGCLDQLAEWANKFNLFDVLKISRTEIRHSNMLAWLMDPMENHGLDDAVLTGFIQYYVTNGADDDEVFDILLTDTNGFEIRREWRKIDLMAISHEARYLICIENKVDSSEHDDQLSRYEKIVGDSFPGFRKMFIYLSPDGMESSNPDVWCAMSYQDVLEIIEKAKAGRQLIPESELLIDNYIETIRRSVVGDDRLVAICAEIYAKHRRALDLIYENRPDKASELAEMFREWGTEKTASGEIVLNLDKCIKSYTRFTTKEMSSVLPDFPEDSDRFGMWNSRNPYFYEIQNNAGKDFSIQFVVSSKDLTDEMKLTIDRINEVSPSKIKKENWKYRTFFSTKRVKVEDELSKEKVFEQLDKLLKDCKAFETKVVEALRS